MDDMELPEADGLDAFLGNLGVEVEKKADVEAPTETSEGTDTGTDTGTEGDTAGDAEEGSQEATEAETDPDDAEVEFKVGETVHKAKLRELKEAFTARAEVTAKAAALATQTQTVQAQDARASAALKSMMERAQARFEPYAKLDMLVLSQRMDTEAFAALRADAAAAEADVKFLSQELDGHMKATNDRSQAAYQESAKACIAALNDPKTGIEGFGKPLYDEIIDFAGKNGVPQVRQLTDPGSLKLVHMAMLYAKAQAAVKAASQKVTKVVNTPKKVLAPSGATQSSDSRKDALSSLKKSGSVEDAENAFFASFNA